MYEQLIINMHGRDPRHRARFGTGFAAIQAFSTKRRLPNLCCLLVLVSLFPSLQPHFTPFFALPKRSQGNYPRGWRFSTQRIAKEVKSRRRLPANDLLSDICGCGQPVSAVPL